MRNVDVRPAKRALGHALGASGFSSLMLRGQSLLYRSGYVRVVNYHATPRVFATSFEEHLRFYARHFAPISCEELVAFIDGVPRHAGKPGLVISFDDGLRSNYDIAAPLLERYGFAGWFFVPVGFIDAPVARQLEFARTHRIFSEPEVPSDGRLAMSWEELRSLTGRHIVGNHTRSHRRLGPSVPADQIQDEVAAARADLERELGHAVRAFCWVGGEVTAYSPEAERQVRQAGYRCAFMNDSFPVLPGTDPLRVQRTNIEASWSLDVVRFQLSGVMDVLSAPKRRQVSELLGG